MSDREDGYYWVLAAVELLSVCSGEWEVMRYESKRHCW